MARPYCTGPAAIFASVSTSGFAFLGHTLGDLQIDTLPVFTPVPNDLTGEKGIDYQFMGEEDLISGTLTRYNEAVLALCQARTYRGIAARGTNGFGAIGGFVSLENHGFGLVLTFPYAVKPAMAAGGMPFGYYYPSAFAEGEQMPVGTKARRIAFRFHTINTFTVANGGSSLLYTNVLPAGLPPID